MPTLSKVLQTDALIEQEVNLFQRFAFAFRNTKVCENKREDESPCENEPYLGPQSSIGLVEEVWNGETDDKAISKLVSLSRFIIGP